MKTISVSLVLAGSMLGAWADPDPAGSPPPPPPPAEKRPPPPDGARRNGRQDAEFWKRADTDGDGFVSRSEFDALKRVAKLPEEKRTKIFERLDKDGDGKLSKKELEPFINAGPPRGFPRLAELDADHSGGVSFEEFQASEFVKKLPLERQKELFKRLDSDGDGQITPKDHPENLPRHEGHEGNGSESGGQGAMSLKQILRTQDANSDGVVTFEEFRKTPGIDKLGEDAQERRFEKLDRNGDKKLTVEDLPPEETSGKSPKSPETEAVKPSAATKPATPEKPPSPAPADPSMEGQ